MYVNACAFAGIQHICVQRPEFSLGCHSTGSFWFLESGSLIGLQLAKEAGWLVSSEDPPVSSLLSLEL